jgi:hypothetical protein
MLSRDSALYEPLSYNNGAIWPFLTGFAILGLYEQGRAPAAWGYLDGTADLTFVDGRGYITELLSGDRLRPIDASVPHQLFATFGYVAGLLRGMVGLRADALVAGDGSVGAGGLRLRPQLPAGWDWLRVHNLRYRDTRFDLDIERGETSIAASVRVDDAAEPPPLAIELTLPVGARPTRPVIESLAQATEATTPGRPGASSRRRGVQINWFPRSDDGSDTLRIEHDGGIEIRPLHEPLRRGDVAQRLRVIDAWIDGDTYTARLEGRGGGTYRVELDTPLQLEAIANARRIGRDGDKLLLEVSFPQDDNDWVTLDVTAHLAAGRADADR